MKSIEPLPDFSLLWQNSGLEKSPGGQRFLARLDIQTLTDKWRPVTEILGRLPMPETFFQNRAIELCGDESFNNFIAARPLRHFQAWDNLQEAIKHYVGFIFHHTEHRPADNDARGELRELEIQTLQAIEGHFAEMFGVKMAEINPQSAERYAPPQPTRPDSAMSLDEVLNALGRSDTQDCSSRHKPQNPTYG